MKTSGMRQYRIVPIEYLNSLFQPETYKGDVFEKIQFERHIFYI